jgi:hypothetical protein
MTENDMKIDSNYIHIKRILQFVEDWKSEFLLNNRHYLRRKKYVNDCDAIRWTCKSPDKIEFISKVYSDEFKNLLIQELKKENCIIKIKLLENGDYSLVVEMNKKYGCLIM